MLKPANSSPAILNRHNPDAFEAMMHTPSFSTLARSAVPIPNLETCQALIVQVRHYRFALPLGAIVRIVSGRSPHFLADASMQLFEGEPLPLIDLERVLEQAAPPRQVHSFSPSLTDQASRFLVVVRFAPHHHYGVMVNPLPQIQRLPLTQAYPLPDFFRRQIANLASHAIVLEDENEAATLVFFLLDLKAYFTL